MEGLTTRFLPHERLGIKFFVLAHESTSNYYGPRNCTDRIEMRADAENDSQDDEVAAQIST